MLLSNNQKSDSADCSIDYATLDVLNNMINEVLINNQSKLKTINCKHSEITMKLLLQDQEKLEHCNCILGKQLTQL